MPILIYWFLEVEKNLISRCIEHAEVPWIQTGTGICHIYVDDEVNQDMTIKIIENAKCSRPSVCNSEEVLLVNSKMAMIPYQS